MRKTPDMTQTFEQKSYVKCCFLRLKFQHKMLYTKDILPRRSFGEYFNRI